MDIAMTPLAEILITVASGAVFLTMLFHLMHATLSRSSAARRKGKKNLMIDLVIMLALLAISVMGRLP